MSVWKNVIWNPDKEQIVNILFVFSCHLLGACCDNAVYLGNGLCLCPLGVCCSLWVSLPFAKPQTIPSTSWKSQLMTLLPNVLNVKRTFMVCSVSGGWTTNAQCILCLWTRMRISQLKRSQWPCIQTTFLPVVSPIQICRWEKLCSIAYLTAVMISNTNHCDVSSNCQLKSRFYFNRFLAFDQ